MPESEGGPQDEADSTVIELDCKCEERQVC
jgi:hypothetical protein